MTNSTASVSFDFAATAKRVTDREVSVARLAHDYSALVAHFGLTPDSASTVITDAARTVVVTGANLSGTKVGESITADMLKGSNPGADAAHLVYWKAARAVRIGLVTAMDKGDKEATETDYLAVAVKAALSAVEHEVTPEAVAAAVALALFGPVETA